MSNLHKTINALASEFAHSLLRALRGASLDEILAETAQGHSAQGNETAHTPRTSKSGRRRRSAKELDHVVTRMVTLLKANKKGLRAEEIRVKLGLERIVIPRPLGEAFRKKLVTKKW